MSFRSGKAQVKSLLQDWPGFLGYLTSGSGLNSGQSANVPLRMLVEQMYVTYPVADPGIGIGGFDLYGNLLCLSRCLALISMGEH